MRLVVGLGNPGKEYEKSKHNIGFICLDAYAKTNRLKFTKSIKFQGEIVKLPEAVLLKPRTFMNNSGLSVLAAVKHFGVEPADILVISDDLDLPFGKIRLREHGSAGGHNGLKSIIDHLQTQEFKRCRIGIDREENKEVIDYVLGDFSKEQRKEIEASLIISTNDIIDVFLKGEVFDTIMNGHNKK
jgi:PTH1 family peptidyl-tRNA hydrolase